MANRNREYIDFLKQKFDEYKFIEFISDLLNLSAEDLNISPVQSKPEQKQFSNTIKYYKFIAKYTSNSDRIGTFIVKLTSEGSQNARTYQRTFIATLLNKYNLDAAIVAFYQDDEFSWRLSFVKKEINYTDRGIKVGLTPAKRYSYLVGENESVHTAQEYLLSLLNIEDRKISLSDIEKVFDVEKVTKKFFEEYKEKYLELKEFLDENEDFITESENCDFTSEEFAKKMMGQIVFLYFLQKKGWLGVQIVPDELSFEEYSNLLNLNDSVSDNLIEKYYVRENNTYKIDRIRLKNEPIKDNINNFVSIFKETIYDKGWGTGDKQFVRNMFRRSRMDHKDNFFDEYLEPLFYSGFNEKRKNQYFVQLNCKIPFLNGGLFEPLNNYRWSSAQFNIPDEMFSNEKKDGILDIFDLYNFTIDEEEPLEKDIAVDPEMLGKIFENLLDIKDRKSTGSFYTPREIVHYMCQESLANYLVNKSDIPYGDIINFIKYGEVYSQIDWLNINNNDKYSHLLPDSIWDNLIDIDKKLLDIKIADPAVGSGAFPLGMLNEIVKLRDNITNYLLIKEDIEEFDINSLSKEMHVRDIYSMKLRTIQNSIYAVDIEISAVEIAKLRLWLSLIVDYPNELEPRPLPNLDCKIMQGNSLVDEYEGVPLFSEKELSNNLKKYKRNMSNNTQIKDIIVQQTIIFDDDSENYESLLSIMFDLQKKYFITSDNDIKKSIKEKIDSIQISIVKQALNGKKEKLDKFNIVSQKKSKPWFIWKLEFFDVFKNNGGFDIVIANPPYIKERDNVDVFRDVNNCTFGKKYHQGKMDYWYYFLHKAIDIINDSGQISFITSRYWINSVGAKKLINRIDKELYFTFIVDIGNLKVFDNVVGHHMICGYTKKNDNNKFVLKTIKNNLNDIGSDTTTENIEISYLYNDSVIRNNEIHLYSSQKYDKVVSLGTVADISQGIVEASATVSKKNFEKYHVQGTKSGDGVFVLSPIEIILKHFSEDEKKLLLPYGDSNIIGRYNVINPQKYVIYSDGIIKESIRNNEKYANIKKHLDLMAPYITSSNKPYGLHRPRKLENFIGKKIVCESMFKFNNFGIDYNNTIFGMSFNVIKSINTKYPVEYLLAVLNSKVILHWFYKNGKHRGVGVDIGVDKLRQVPIPIVKNDNEILDIVEMVDNLSNHKENNSERSIIEDKIENRIYELFDISNEEKKEIKEFYDTLVSNNK